MSDHSSSAGISDPLAPLALRPREAARALGIGTRLLWQLTNTGEIPHLRLGRAVVYPVDSLRAWLAEQAEKGGRR
jgi:excisionase family DNA binding protein